MILLQTKCKVCVLVACLACACDARRAKTALDQFSDSQDVNGQKLVKQRYTIAGSGSGGHANHSGSGQFVKGKMSPWKVIPVLLAFLRPTAAFGIGSTPIRAHQQSTLEVHQQSISKNPIRAHAGPRVEMFSLGDSLYGDEEAFLKKVLTKDGANYKQEALTGFGEPTVRAVVSVDWEGDDLLLENLRAFEDFHEAHPDVPLTHFLNAAYFSKAGANFLKTGSREWRPQQALRPINESGLHLHGWESLAKSAGVEYRSEPTYFLQPVDNQTLRGTDAGHEVDIRAYSVDELQAIIANSKVLLAENGLEVGKAFRAGAWLGGPNVLEAIRREGFLVDSSAVDADKVLGRLAGQPLVPMLRELWPTITNESQPFPIETPAGLILEMPDTGALADYSTAEEMVEHIDNAVKQLDSEDRFVDIGFHQETAARFAPRVIAAIKEVKNKHGDRVVFETLEASAQRAIEKLRSTTEEESTEVQSPEVEPVKRGRVQPRGSKNKAKTEKESSEVSSSVTMGPLPIWAHDTNKVKNEKKSSEVSSAVKIGPLPIWVHGESQVETAKESSEVSSAVKLGPLPIWTHDTGSFNLR